MRRDVHDYFVLLILLDFAYNFVALISREFDVRVISFVHLELIMNLARGRTRDLVWGNLIEHSFMYHISVILSLF